MLPLGGGVVVLPEGLVLVLVLVSRFACPGTTPPWPGGGLVLRPGARSRALLLFGSRSRSGCCVLPSCRRPGVVEFVEPLLPLLVLPDPEVEPLPLVPL